MRPLFHIFKTLEINRHFISVEVLATCCRPSPLQRVLNAATPCATDLRLRDHVTSVQRSLHWLPIHQRIEYKLSILMYMVVFGTAPDYISNSVTLTSAMPGRSHLRSAGSLTFDIPRTCTRRGDQATSVAGPRTWNKLPLNIRQSTSIVTFNKKKLKTHLIDTAYNV